MKIWENFYEKYLGVIVDPSDVKIPERTLEQAKEFTRLIIVAQGLKLNQVYNACDRRFPCYKYANDLNGAVFTNDRDPEAGSYAIWVRDTVDADEVHKSKSANMIKTAGLKTETLLERMLQELKYFAETGKHLDMNGFTLCCGSRGSRGYVPSAGWRSGEFKVGWNDTDFRNNVSCSREVVTP